MGYTRMGLWKKNFDDLERSPQKPSPLMGEGWVRVNKMKKST